MAKIFDIEIYPFDTGELVQYVNEVLTLSDQKKIMYVNVHVLNLAYTDRTLKLSLSAADRIYCDGEGVRLGAKLLGEELPIRTTGADWIHDLSTFCSKDNYSIFFLGGEPNVADKAAIELKKIYPNLIISGTADGYFNKTNNENLMIIEKINSSNTDIVLVGLGTPLQENWIIQNASKINAKVLWAVGGLFGYLGGAEMRAPAFMHRNSLEWLFRLIINPKRLMNRYILGIPLFYFRVFAYTLRKKIK